MTTQNSQPQVFKGSWGEDLENIVFTDNLTSSLTIGLPSFFIQPDGTKIFILNSGIVETRSLPTPWDFGTLGAIGNTFTITDDATPTGLFFRDDGTKMFVVGQTTKTIYEYTLPIPFNTDSIVDNPVSLSLSAVTNDVIQCAFSRDGDFLYITDGVSVYGFPLPTPWDVTSNVSNVSFTPVSGIADSVAFKREGDKMYVGEIASPSFIREYNLSTINDITTAAPTGDIFNFGVTNKPVDIIFKPTGLEFFHISSFLVRKAHIGTAWNIGTATYFSNFKLTTSNNVRGVAWRPDGLKMYSAERDADVIREFTVTTPWNITTASEGSTFNISPIDPNVSNLWWKPDGTRLYIIGISTNAVIQLNASTPYDVSTLSDPGISFTPSVGGANLIGLFFRDDGNKMYLSITDDTIREYDLTDWDITTLTEVGNKDFTVVGSSIQSIFFKFDGTQLLSLSFTPKTITRTKLAIPWDIESAVFDITDTFSVQPQINGPLSMFVRYDAEKIFISGNSVNMIFSYDLLQEFNNSLITNLGDELVTDLGESLVHS